MHRRKYREFQQTPDSTLAEVRLCTHGECIVNDILGLLPNKHDTVYCGAHTYTSLRCAAGTEGPQVENFHEEAFAFLRSFFPPRFPSVWPDSWNVFARLYSNGRGDGA